MSLRLTISTSEYGREMAKALTLGPARTRHRQPPFVRNIRLPMPVRVIADIWTRWSARARISTIAGVIGASANTWWLPICRL
ncbi:MAG: hypothetical protein B7Y47_03875 [Sphingomonas sp. 28-63-12]|nr:MAG: hypothetical protein B7Y47_03875 [Sphingomonas sp. 28-63-12]